MFLVNLITCFLLGGLPPSNDGGYGKVVFANSGSAAAQKDLLAGVALLHDFEYPAGLPPSPGR